MAEDALYNVQAILDALAIVLVYGGEMVFDNPHHSPKDFRGEGGAMFSVLAEVHVFAHGPIVGGNGKTGESGVSPISQLKAKFQAPPF